MFSELFIKTQLFFDVPLNPSVLYVFHTYDSRKTKQYLDADAGELFHKVTAAAR